MTDNLNLQFRARKILVPPEVRGLREFQSQANRSERRPRSDLGTIALHWTLVASILVSLATGLRLAADDENNWFARILSPVLPQGEIWTPHFLAAFFVLLCMAAYAFYIRLGHLQRRVSLRKIIILTLPVAPKLRWGSFNVILYWLLFVTLLSLVATGVLLYIGWGGVVLTLHYIAALTVLGYIGIHVFSHFNYGGINQLLRLVRPQALRIRRGAVAWPFAIAMGAGIAAATGFYVIDVDTRDVLVITRITAPPRIDGDLSDPAWAHAQAVTIHTMAGANLGSTGEASGESTVTVRAVHDVEDVYFAFRWEDPTRSIKRLPLVKKEDGWHMMNTKEDIADESTFYEDKFTILFSRSDAFGSGGSTHMGPQPLADKPGALNKRGLHYTTDGSYMDLWQWKASRGGMLGMLDDMWFGPPVEPNAGQADGTLRYSAGYDGDPGHKFYDYNWVNEPPGGYKGAVKLVKLPKDWRKTMAKLGTISFDPSASDDADSQWWMFEDETVPYDASMDATIPVGTVMPSILISGAYSGSRADVRGAAKWQDGYWSLEVVRKLRTEDAVKDLPMESGLFMWVAAFDRTQTRHTRHVRPVELELQ